MFINLCVFFCFHRICAHDLIYLIAYLHSTGLTLEAHLQHCLWKEIQQFVGIDCCQDQMVELVKYGCVCQLPLKLLPPLCTNGSDKRSPKVFGGETQTVPLKYGGQKGFSQMSLLHPGTPLLHPHLEHCKVGPSLHHLVLTCHQTFVAIIVLTSALCLCPLVKSVTSGTQHGRQLVQCVLL